VTLRTRVEVALSGASIGAPPSGGAWIYLGSSAESYFRTRSQLQGLAEIPAGPLLNAIADEFRDELLNFDATLDVRNELRWQTTDLAERNPFTSGFLHACCSALALVRLAARDSDLLVVVDDAQLGSRLEEVVERHADVDLVRRTRRHVPSAAARFVLGELVSGLRHRFRFVRGSARTRRQVSRRLEAGRFASPVDTLIVTWVDPTTFEPGTRIERERYFGELPEALRDAGCDVGYLADTRTWPAGAVDLLGGLEASGDPVVVIDEVTRPREALRLVAATLARPARGARPFVVDGVDLTGFVSDELWRDWGKARQMEAMRDALVWKYVRGRGLTPRRIIHLFENQPWEKALRIGCAGPGAPQVVACQHTPINSHWFSFFPSRRDLRAGSLPERVFVIGDLWRRLLEAHGYPPERLQLAPPLRYSLSGSPGRPGHASADGVKNVLVAGSIGLSDSLELVTKAVVAFGSLEQIQIVVKLHPKLAITPEGFGERLQRGADRLPALDRLSFRSGSVPETLAEVDLVLYTTTTVAYEALAAGIPIVFVQSDFWFDADPIPSDVGPERAARTPDEIARLAAPLLDSSSAERREHLARGRELVADAFADGDASDFASILLAPQPEPAPATKT
jgi:hypothetical protein